MFVVTSDGVLVADGQGSPEATKGLVDAIARVTDKPIKYVVVCSDHGDHTAGNGSFPAGVTYIIHPASKMILDRQAATARADAWRLPSSAELVSDKRTLTIGGEEIQILFLGRALLRPSVLRASSIRRFLVGSRRRDDARFIARLVRHGTRARPRTLSARAIIWANQPRRWNKARALLPGGEQRGIRIDGRLAELSKIPTLVLWGDEDRVISATDARRCKELPLAQVRIAHGVGHSLPLEVAAWANEHIAKFVAGLTTTELRAA